MRTKLAALLIPILLTACHPPSQNRYGYQDVGKNTLIEYGRVVSARPVDITGKNHGVGAAAGAAGGAIAGAQIGSGDGSLAGALAGALIVGIVGHMAEQAVADSTGVEYIVKMENGSTQSIVQNVAPDDAPIAVGQRVMVQLSGDYRRVMPAEEEKKPVKKRRKQ